MFSRISMANSYGHYANSTPVTPPFIPDLLANNALLTLFIADNTTDDLKPKDMPGPMEGKYSEYEKTLTANGSKLGGYPYFIRSKPR